MAEKLTREQGGVIAASKVKGTDVYNTSGDHLGSISDVVIEKVSGSAKYAVMSFGGFLGIGEDEHPIPWDKLTYSVEQDGYVVDIPKETLESAPRYEPGRHDQLHDRAFEERIYTHYGSVPYW